MELYLSDTQKSSDLLPADYRIGYGLSLSVAATAIKAGMTAHIRIYDAALRLGWAGLLVTAAELLRDMNNAGIPLSPAQAQRVLKDECLFSFVCERKTGKRGRQAKCYRMVDPKVLCASLGFPFGAVNYAPKMMPVDFSSVLHYKLAMVGRGLYVRRDDCRLAQIETWDVSKSTIIRWTREVSLVFPQIERVSSDHDFYGWHPAGKDMFLLKVNEAAKGKRHKFWLEVITEDGEIIRLPCEVEIARRWLLRSVVTLCEQQPNYYSVHSAYRDPPTLVLF
jgi:hypothetical protein